MPAPSWCGRCLEPHDPKRPCRDGGKHHDPHYLPEDQKTVEDYLLSNERKELIAIRSRRDEFNERKRQLEEAAAEEAKRDEAKQRLERQLGFWRKMEGRNQRENDG